MSDILIKGMEMPKGCATCPYCDRAWNKPKCKAKSTQGRFMEQRLNLDRTRQKWCPLVPVPKHGRLIDADAAIADIRGEILEHQMNGMKGTPFYIEDLRTMWQRLEDEELVPTIIPAEEGEA